MKTSIQYQLSNEFLFKEIILNWENFNNELKKGPAEMKKYLYKKWNEVKEYLEKKENIEIQDKDKVINEDNFDVTYNKTSNNSDIFYFTFPNYDFFDAASKYVALALTKKGPRYFTLEYSSSPITNEPYWVIGEFIIDNNIKKHINIDRTDNMRLSWFSGYIIGMLEAENL